MRALVHVPPTSLAQVGAAVVLVVGAVALGLGVAEVAYRIASRITKRTAWHWDDDLVARLRGPSRTLLGVAFLPLLLLLVDLDPKLEHVLYVAARGVFIAGLTWLLLRLAAGLADRVEERAREREKRDSQVFVARGLETKIAVLRRIVAATIVVFGSALVLLQFDAVRSVGMSVLASAGVAGIVIGFAAQKTLGNVLAGLQLSIAQPLRLGDSVIVDDEFGTVEEVNLTYVVLKLWDQRRMVVPVQRLLDQPFQNWTRTETQLLGAVSLHLDFDAPLEAIRRKLDEILQGNARWDGRVKSVQVTDASEQTQEVRLLVSAGDAGTLFDLRCEVREKMLTWLAAENDGRYLPRTRFDAGEAVDEAERTEPRRRMPAFARG